MLASTLTAYLLASGHQGQYGEDGQHMASLLQPPGGSNRRGEATSASLAYRHLMGSERWFWKRGDARLPNGRVWEEKYSSSKTICSVFNQLAGINLVIFARKRYPDLPTSQTQLTEESGQVAFWELSVCRHKRIRCEAVLTIY